MFRNWGAKPPIPYPSDATSPLLHRPNVTLLLGIPGRAGPSLSPSDFSLRNLPLADAPALWLPEFTGNLIDGSARRIERILRRIQRPPIRLRLRLHLSFGPRLLPFRYRPPPLPRRPGLHVTLQRREMLHLTTAQALERSPPTAPAPPGMPSQGATGDCKDFAFRADAERRATLNLTDMATFRAHIDLALELDCSARGPAERRQAA